MAEVVVNHEPDRKRYVLEVDGRQVGLVTYRLKDQQIAFLHAEVDPTMEGQGLASRLAAFALDDARGRGLSVLPMCPFVSSYIASHGDYLDLVPVDERPRFGL